MKDDLNFYIANLGIPIIGVVLIFMDELPLALVVFSIQLLFIHISTHD